MGGIAEDHVIVVYGGLTDLECVISIGTADYAPVTCGLQAALPFVDDFLPVRTLSNLADLAVHLNAAV
jgi:hypothetical protein